MKLSILQENLDKGLTTVAKAVAVKSSLPILGNVLLATDQGRLKLTATNLETVITTWIGAKVDAEGAITLPAHVLTDWVKSMPPERIDLTLNEQTATATLKCGRHHANIKGIAAAEFPAIPTATREICDMDPDVLKQMIQQVEFCAAKDDHRPVLTGVLLSLNDDTLTMVTADGYRLSVRSAHTVEGIGGEWKCVVPAVALREAAKLIGDQEAPVTIAEVGEHNQVVIRTEQAELISQVIDGAYPDWHRIVPEAFESTVQANVSEVTETVKAASIFAKDSAYAVQFALKPSKNGHPSRMEICSRSPESGDMESELDVSMEGKALAVKLDARYLAQALAVMSAPVMSIQFNATGPCAFRMPGYADFVHVIMPITGKG